MSFPNVSDIVTTTLENRSGEIADNVTNNNALLWALNKKGNVKTFDGGRVIFQELSFAQNGNGGSYSGMDALSTTQQDVISSPQFPIAQYAVPVVISGLEELQNSGKEQVIDLLDARMDVAVSTMKNLLNQHLYLDGTGNSGKNLTGLAAAVPLANTSGTYGSINRATWSFWQNQKWQASVDGSGMGGVITTANAATSAYQQMLQLYLACVRGTDTPKIGIAGSTLYGLYLGALQNLQRFTSSDATMASAGFENVKLNGMPIVFENTASGIASTTAYFLNTDYLFFRPHAKRNMVPLSPDRVSFNQDAAVSILAWAGNLTCSGAKFQGIFSNT